MKLIWLVYCMNLTCQAWYDIKYVPFTEQWDIIASLIMLFAKKYSLSGRLTTLLKYIFLNPKKLSSPSWSEEESVPLQISVCKPALVWPVRVIWTTSKPWCFSHFLSPIWCSNSLNLSMISGYLYLDYTSNDIYSAVYNIIWY